MYCYLACYLTKSNATPCDKVDPLKSFCRQSFWSASASASDQLMVACVHHSHNGQGRLSWVIRLVKLRYYCDDQMKWVAWWISSWWRQLYIVHTRGGELSFALSDRVGAGGEWVTKLRQCLRNPRQRGFKWVLSTVGCNAVNDDQWHLLEQCQLADGGPFAVVGKALRRERSPGWFECLRRPWISLGRFSLDLVWSW